MNGAAFGRIALVASALCITMATSPSYAEVKSSRLLCIGYAGTETLTDFQALVKLEPESGYGFSYADYATMATPTVFLVGDATIARACCPRRAAAACGQDALPFLTAST